MKVGLTNDNVLAAYSYYPFGMQMPGRSFVDVGYRYAYNGKERDEFSGTGNDYDFGARIYNSRIGRFLSVDPLWNSLEKYTPYNYAVNNPILLIDENGNGPRLPNWKITARVFLYNPTMFDALFSSNNTSIYMLNEWAKGRANKKEKNKLLGAVGEAIAMERLIEDSPMSLIYRKKSIKEFGRKYRGHQIDIYQEIATGIVRYRALNVDLIHELGIRDFNPDGSQNPIKKFHGPGHADAEFKVLYEVKTLSPDNTAQYNYDKIVEGINQVIERAGTETDNNLGVLIVDKGAWMKVYEDESLRPKLLEKFEELKQSGNFLRLEEDLYRESERALYGVKDKIKDIED